jgi:hypothetical protein
MLTLTPQARAIAAFTISVLLILGRLNKIAFAFVLTFGDSYPTGRGGQFLTSVLLIGIAGAATAFAVSAVNAVGASQGWDAHLARAAVVVGVLGVVMSVLIGIGSVANDSGSLPDATFNFGFLFS